MKKIMIEIAHFTTLGHDRAKPELPKTVAPVACCGQKLKGLNPVGSH